MLVVNVFAGPGAGKSTTAAGVFYKLKQLGVNVELVTEYAKDMTWEGRSNILGDQLYITAKQNRRLARLLDKVDVVITDSPLLLGIHYATPEYVLAGTYETMVTELFNSYDNINFVIPRKTKYNPIGRSQTEDEAKTIDTDIRNMLDKLGIAYIDKTCDPSEVVDEVMRDILRIIPMP